jgi:hypothetical protein
LSSISPTLIPVDYGGAADSHPHLCSSAGAASAPTHPPGPVGPRFRPVRLPAPGPVQLLTATLPVQAPVTPSTTTTTIQSYHPIQWRVHSITHIYTKKGITICRLLFNL